MVSAQIVITDGSNAPVGKTITIDPCDCLSSLKAVKDALPQTWTADVHYVIVTRIAIKSLSNSQAPCLGECDIIKKKKQIQRTKKGRTCSQCTSRQP
jgi:hypothetical protein